MGSPRCVLLTDVEPATHFFAKPVSLKLCQEVEALSPANPLYTAGFVAAMRSLGAEPWILGIQQDERMIAACPAFFRRGAIESAFEIVSVPELPEPNVFWRGLANWSRKIATSRLNVGSFCSKNSVIPSLPGETRRRNRWEFVLDLTKTDWEGRIHRSHRANIRQARKYGVEIRRTTDVSAYEDHRRLVLASRKRRAARGEDVPGTVNSEEHRAYLRNGVAEVFQAVLGGEIVSSDLVLKSSRGVYGESAGTSPEGMRCNAAHLLIYEMALAFQRESKQTLNMGGCDAPDSGLATFKSYFGTNVVKLEAAEFGIGSSWTKLANLARFLKGSVVSGWRADQDGRPNSGNLLRRARRWCVQRY